MAGERAGRCESCRHFLDMQQPGELETTNEDWGYCHRYPPVLDTAGPRDPIELRWLRPVVMAGDWCGEWRRNRRSDGTKKPRHLPGF